MEDPAIYKMQEAKALQGNPQKPEILKPPDDDYGYFNGVRTENNNPHPVVIIVKSMTTLQACQIGKMLTQYGVTGVMQGGPLAEQLVQQWVDRPLTEEPVKRWKHKK